MASPLVQQGWLYATVPIDNPVGESGTGFLVVRNINSDKGRIFLVTNKHVISKDPVIRPSVTHIKCHFNAKTPSNDIGIISRDIPLNNPDSTKRFREHPDPDTDVFVIEVTDIMLLNPEIEKRWVSYDLFALEAKRKELDITIGEDVIIIGYPLGLRQGSTNFPLIRQGLISTTIGSLVKDKVKNPDGSIRNRSLRAFLIDGATVPGSSGSPVLLKPVIGRLQGNNIVMGTSEPVLLGIVAETKYAPIKYEDKLVPGFAGLGLAFEVETIKETIELFFT